ncbi:MAG: DUF2007 domain-containing protein [Parabacteroides sp.]
MENLMQAQMLCDMLQNEGIEAFIKNKTMSTVLNPAFQPEIHVYEKDYPAALNLLKTAFPYLGY